MTEQRTYQASASSLIDLKAELYRKREAFNQEKLNRALGKPSVRSPSSKKGDIWANKNTGVNERNAKDLAQEAEKDSAILKAKAVLERKTKLYEYLSKGNTVEGNENGQLFLVNFEKKVIDESREKRDHHSESIIIEDIGPHYCESVDPDGGDKQSDDPVFLNLEEHDGPVHYQNVQNEEIRQHGTGYFAFSQDEEERKRQMENLHRMTEQTNKQRLEREKLKEKRKAMLKARLNKVRQRKNIKIEEESSEKHSENSESENDEKDQISLEDIPLPASEPPPAEETPSKKPYVRPWDRGKISEPVHRPPPPKFKKVSQESWIEERREERQQEFAPPSMYFEQPRRPLKQFGGRQNGSKWKNDGQRDVSEQYGFTPGSSSTFASESKTSRPSQTEDKGTPTYPDPISEALAYFRNQSNPT